MEKEQLARETRELAIDILEKAQIAPSDIVVLGLSTSEVVGGQIGRQSSQEIGDTIVKTLIELADERGFYLAVQGCEHVNRALVVERQIAQRNQLEIVNVRPTLHAGGSGQVAAFRYMKDPVEVEFITAQAGIDIGDTAIGMHIKHVQVPIRPAIRTLGAAHVTALASRPKLIGGERASYQPDPIRKGF